MFTGILLAVLSGVFWGVCFLPMRYMKRFAWENTWFIWALTGCVLFPPLIAWLTIPSLFRVLSEVGLRLNLIVLGMGLIAGTSGICIGLALSRVGMTITNSLSNGVSLAVGAFVPLAIQHREILQNRIGFIVCFGLVLSIIGVIICALAGSQRGEESAYGQHDYAGGDRTRKIILQGIFLSIASGLLTPLQNLGMAFADDYMKVARSYGSPEAFMSFAFYIPYFGTSFVSNGIYCAWLWKKNDSLRQFCEPGAVVFALLAVSMAALWIAGSVFYGWSMPWMYSFGPVIAWPVSLATTNVASAIAEFFYGDWEGRALRTLVSGLLVLSLAILAFGVANLLIQDIGK